MVEPPDLRCIRVAPKQALMAHQAIFTRGALGQFHRNKKTGQPVWVAQLYKVEFKYQYTATVLAIQASISIGESSPMSYRCNLLISVFAIEGSMF
ncbi:MAG: hypothetical protein H6641_14905 [Caldilineaceae bacterium]|nr:hypothetical protein [Caldilineaceae bacterium]